MIEYIRFIADNLGLKDWTFEIRDKHDDDVLANIRIPYGQKHASIYLSPEFDDGSENLKRETVIHELLHCHFKIADHIVAIANIPTYPIFDLMMEYAVDGLAVALSSRFPTPKEFSDGHSNSTEPLVVSPGGLRNNHASTIRRRPKANRP